jgi:hypothetical protein
MFAGLCGLDPVFRGDLQRLARVRSNCCEPAGVFTKRRSFNITMKSAFSLFASASARSQMAEAWMNQICGGEFEAQSAGPSCTLNPLSVEVMSEGHRYFAEETQRVFDV